MDKDREKRLQTIAENINKALKKKDAVIFLGNKDIPEMPRFSSGNSDFDDALGGGWPIGRFIEIYGDPSCGKSTICFHSIAEFQKSFPKDEVGLVDSEGSWDIKYAKKIGVDVESVLVHQPDDGEEAVNVMLMWMEQGVRLIIVDSLAALAVRAETAEDFGSTKEGMGAQARLASDAFRRLQPKVAKTGTTVIITNQTRSQIGVVYGDPTTTPGGKALKFYSSIRVQLGSSIGEKDESGIPTFIICKVKVKKNKVAPPFKETSFAITFGNGIDNVAGLFDRAINKGVIQIAGAWVKYEGETIGQGKMNVLEVFREDDEFQEEIKEKLKEVEKKERELKDAPKEKRKIPRRKSPPPMESTEGIVRKPIAKVKPIEEMAKKEE